VALTPPRRHENLRSAGYDVEINEEHRSIFEHFMSPVLNRRGGQKEGVDERENGGRVAGQRRKEETERGGKRALA